MAKVRSPAVAYLRTSSAANVRVDRDSSRQSRHPGLRQAGSLREGDDLTDSDDEFRVTMRQIMGVFSQLEKTRLVKKLKAARDRKRTNGKVEGRKSRAKLRQEIVAEAKRLHRGSPHLPPAVVAGGKCYPCVLYDLSPMSRVAQRTWKFPQPPS